MELKRNVNLHIKNPAVREVSDKGSIGKQSCFSGTFISLVVSHSSYIFFTVVFLIGIVLGGFFSSRFTVEFLQKIDFLLFSQHSAVLTDSGTVFISSFSSLFLFAVFFLAMGFSLWGFWCIPFFLGFRGFGLGLTAGHLYITYGWKGLCGYCFTILPGASIASFALILLAQYFASVSRNILHNKKMEYSQIFYRFGFILVIMFTASIIDTFCNFCFSDIFFS